MMRPSSSSFRLPGHARNSTQTARGVSDFLRGNDKLASLLPAAGRMAELQKECSDLLPAAFENCAVVRFESGQLTLSVANGALAAKLKQQLPKLQDGLLRRGFQVSAVRLKLQPGNIVTNVTKRKSLRLPNQAVSAFAELNDTLDDTPQNGALKAAVAAMLSRHRG